jgi:flavin reductase (DIM6/NTAB) family NADH-FMN oxidoreductase RutF
MTAVNNTFEEIDIKSIVDNVFQLFDDEWMLVTAGTGEKFNTMTASWGSFGILWNKPIAICFIRPQRYTLGFVEKQDYFTLSFFSDKYRNILNFCGQKSGRDIDKIKKTGLIPFETALGNIGFQQARMILECKKIYADFIIPDKFIDTQIINKIYPTNDFHKFFIGEIIHCYLNKE